MNRTTAKIKYYADKHGIPYEILLGIYTLETTYRVAIHRFAENSIVTILLFLNIMFGVRVKNFTIGHCQVGLATILICSGSPVYRHSKHLVGLSLQDCSTIIRAMRKNTNINCCAQYISSVYSNFASIYGVGGTLVRRLGELYNGTYTYGLLLDNLVLSYESAAQMPTHVAHH